jgi:hypothetical protein
MIMPMTLQQAKDEITMLTLIKDADFKYWKEQRNNGVLEDNLLQLYPLKYMSKIIKPTIRAKLFIRTELVERIMRKQYEAERRIAINKIKRNAIYNNGLGLKLAVKAYSKDF